MSGTLLNGALMFFRVIPIDSRTKNISAVLKRGARFLPDMNIKWVAKLQKRLPPLKEAALNFKFKDYLTRFPFSNFTTKQSLKVFVRSAVLYCSASSSVLNCPAVYLK